MSIITLTTDWGVKDYFISVVKASIFSFSPEAKVFDISHDITPYNLNEASYMLKASYLHFPEGSIHILGVDCEPSTTRSLIILKTNGHYFLGANNGVFSLLLEEGQAFETIELESPSSCLFPVKDILVKAATSIYNGTSWLDLGKEISKPILLKSLKPQIKDSDTLSGVVMYIDRFGNAISNIHQDLFNSLCKGRSFEVKFGQKYKFNKIYNSYSDVLVKGEDLINFNGKEVLLFNSAGFLEIALYKSNVSLTGGASSLLGLNINSNIIIKFT